MFFRLLERGHGGGGGGGGADGEGGDGQQWGGGQQRGGGGSKAGVSLTSKNRPLHHKYKSPKQFELKQSWKAIFSWTDFSSDAVDFSSSKTGWTGSAQWELSALNRPKST